jgi:hypothetical protein
LSKIVKTAQPEGPVIDRIEQLLNIVDKARHWPNLKPIHDAAMEILERLAHPKPDKKHPPGTTNPFKFETPPYAEEDNTVAIGDDDE